MQIEFLEVRLAEVMAYADIPPSMRPALSEFNPTGIMHMQAALAVAGAGGGGMQAMPPSPSARAASAHNAAVGTNAARAKELEASKARVARALMQLRDISRSLCKRRMD